MTSEDIRRFKQAAPFQPFVIRLIDGREYVIRHPDFVWMNEKSLRTVTLADDKGKEITINTTIVVSIHEHVSRRKVRRGTA